MKTLPKELILDKNNLWYIDGDKVDVKKVILENPTFTFTPKSSFYALDSTNDYIVKVDNRICLFLEYKLRKMLHHLSLLESKIPNIDFPIGYYKKNDKIIGTIVPYYKDGISIRKVIGNYSIHNLNSIYNYNSNEINNVVHLYLEILDLLRIMYENKLMYLDVHSGNFIITNNEIKLIDFDPDYLKYKNSYGYYEKIIEGYLCLINKINRYLNLSPFYIYETDSFSEIEKNVKLLTKILKYQGKE